ncbi:Conserved_hypothetical protein [Hexamita inflata]|uniref:Uncharacterized protein n=2 Tax=Hexamita inflata TaxID=28002 RepID=A0AA86PP70_9EUKA|nr:Conserved hypothetical protein [Hexamita inflata]
MILFKYSFIHILHIKLIIVLIVFYFSWDQLNFFTNNDFQQEQLQTEEELFATVRPEEDKDVIIEQLNEQLRLANEELLEVQENQLETRRTQIKLQEEGKTVEQLEYDMELMRQTMAEEDKKKAEDKEELIMLKEENEELIKRVSYLEEQILMIKKCFGGLRSVCEGAEDRLEEVLGQGQEGLNITVGDGRVQWK